jgi:hypothetical protein
MRHPAGRDAASLPGWSRAGRNARRGHALAKDYRLCGEGAEGASSAMAVSQHPDASR